MIRVLIAEDQGMIRGALTTLLDLEDDLEVIAQASNGEEAVRLALVHLPDVALLDIEMPKISGLDALSQIHTHLPFCKVLIVTTFARPGYLQRAIKAGASGYLLKDAAIEELCDAIRVVHGGGKVISPDLMMAAWGTENPLTERELSLLRLAAKGLTTRELARQLYLSEGTVRNYMSEILSKLDVQTRSEAIKTAEKSGWL